MIYEQKTKDLKMNEIFEEIKRDMDDFFTEMDKAIGRTPEEDDDELPTSDCCGAMVYEDLEIIMNESCKSWWRPIRKKIKQSSNDLKTQIKMFISGLHGHLQPLEISEDSEKITVKMKPCGSGGRLVQEGKYEGRDSFLMLKKAQKITYGRTDFPVYCAHEAAMENVDFEDDGTPFVIVEPAKEIGKDYCSFICYKKDSYVPKKYYERLGYKKK